MSENWSEFDKINLSLEERLPGILLEKEITIANHILKAANDGCQCEPCIAARAAAKEQLTDWMITNSFATGHGDTFADLLKELTWQIAELRQAARHDDAAQEEAAMFARDYGQTFKVIRNAILEAKQTGDYEGALKVIEAALEGK